MYALFPKQAKDFLGRREDRFYDVPIQSVEVTIDPFGMKESFKI